MVAILQKYEDLYNVKITFSVETEPLGTGMLLLPTIVSPWSSKKTILIYSILDGRIVGGGKQDNVGGKRTSLTNWLTF